MAALLDRCMFVPTAGGTADFTVSTAVTGYMTPATAGATNATTYYYGAESSDKSQWELGLGTYSTSGPTLARTTILFSSNANAKTNFTNPPNVFITLIAENKTSSADFGLAKVDGTSIRATAGVLNAAPAYNLQMVPSSSGAQSFASFGNVFTTTVAITVTELSALLTTVNSATYQLGIAPFNTGTNKITNTPTYGPTVTIGSSAGAANTWIKATLSTPLSLAVGTYLFILVRTDSTTTVSQTLWFTLTSGTGSILHAPGILQANASGSKELASTGPTTSDTWSSVSGFWIFDMAYFYT